MKFHTLRLYILAFAATVSLFWLAAMIDANPSNGLETHNICASAIGHTEREHNIPNDLLTAIAQTESDRWDSEREAVFT